MRKKVIIFLALVLPLSVIGQNKKVFNRDMNFGEYTPLSVSYYGNLGIYSGIKFGFDWNLRMLEKEVNKRRRTKTIRRLIILSPHISYYNHRQSHRAFIIGGDISFRRYSKRLFFREIGFGLAYQRKFNSGQTWEVGSDGRVKKLGLSSRGYFSPSLSLSCGKRFTIAKSVSFDAFGRVNSFLLTNYNAVILPELSLELGVRISLKYGIKRGKINLKTKQKK